MRQVDKFSLSSEPTSIMRAGKKDKRPVNDTGSSVIVPKESFLAKVKRKLKKEEKFIRVE